ncbi:hypothetical protein BJX99DRAFT_253927 [Aspergillus californicus]
MSEEESLLTNLCAICHIQPPKYRCPRCSTRTCSLPCTRRHKLWSECSGIRDPAAYMRRNELSSESAFDKDFNFITGIERHLERAEREAENRGVQVDVKVNRVRDAEAVGLDPVETHEEVGTKRKRQGPGKERSFVKGELGFLNRAKDAGVKVIQAPRGMTRARENGSKWHQRHKCLQWTVEWATFTGTAADKKKMNSVDTSTIAEAYDRAFPLSREEKEQKRLRNQTTTQEDEQPETTHNPNVETDPQPTTSDPPNTEPLQPTYPEHQTATPVEKSTSHRNLYFYLHRPRTTTKQPVLIPIMPDMTLANALRGRVVLEFPTIYAVQNALNEDPPNEAKFMLETEYLRTHPDPEPMVEEGTDIQPPFAVMDIPDVDEGKVMEVLQKDLLAVAPAGTSQ